MRRQRWGWMLVVVMLGAVGRLHAEDIGCVSTTFRVLGANDKICVSAFDDPKVPGGTCHLSQARTGGMKGTVGVAEDRSRFALACRQVGPITVDLTTLPKKAEVFSAKTSLLFKGRGSCEWLIWHVGRWCIWRIAPGWSKGPPLIASPRCR
jgi:CreA protein